MAERSKSSLRSKSGMRCPEFETAQSLLLYFSDRSLNCGIRSFQINNRSQSLMAGARSYLNERKDDLVRFEDN